MLGLLGTLLVVDETGLEVAVVAPRQRVLLAALALQANQVVPAEALAEQVWDGAPPHRAAITLRSHIRRLRIALGPGWAARIVSRTPGYLYRTDDEDVDVLAFESLCRRAGAAVREQRWTEASDFAGRAVALWRGPPLLDVSSQMLRDKFVPWLERLLTQVLEDQAEAELQLGCHERLVAPLRDLVAQYPLRERLHAQLMLALHRAGRRAEALTAYQQARRTLVDELGVEPGPQLRRLHERILAGEEADPAAPPGRPESSAGAHRPRPRQLPAAAGNFTGRAAELEWLTGLPDRGEPSGAGSGGTVVVCAVDGMAGIGKTALAVHSAHRLADRFEDGQLFLDLHGYTEGQLPREPGQALEALLRTLGVPAGEIPGDTDERAALYRQRLAGTRTMIVLDNAVDGRQVRPLLPGDPGCLVLVTSRRRLKGLDDALNLSLDLLPPDDATALLRAVAGPGRLPPDDPMLGEIAALCGQLPLALRIAGALLRHRPAWSPEHLAGMLRDQHHRIDALSDGERDLGTVLDLSYASLDEQHQVLFRRLGLIPGPDTDDYAAAALLECDPCAATRLLEDLIDHNLLTEHAPGRYRLHDLLRALAAALAAADPRLDRDAATDRLLDYYHHTAARADALLDRYPRPAPAGPAPARLPVLSDAQAARAWLRNERFNLLAAIHRADDHADHERLIDLTADVAGLMRSDGPWSEAIALHGAALTAAHRSRRRLAEAAALVERGHIWSLTGEFREATRDLQRARDLYRNAGKLAGQAMALTELGRVHALTGDHLYAVAALREALQLSRAANIRECLIAVLTELGRVRSLIGEYPGAGQDLREALTLCRVGGDQRGEATALTWLGQVRSVTGDYAGATRDLREALRLCRAVDERLGQAHALTLLGAAKSTSSDLPAATQDIRQALELYRELGNRNGLARALTESGNVRGRAGDLQGGMIDLQNAVVMFRQIGARGNEAWALNHHATTTAAAGFPAEAHSLYQEALSLARQTHQPREEALALEGIATCQQAEDETRP